MSLSKPIVNKASITIKDFEPFFFVKVGRFWNKSHAEEFLAHLRRKVGRYYKSSITDSILVKRKTLYGFDANKKYKFVCLKFKNTIILNKCNDQ